MEIFVEAGGGVIFKKYSPMGELQDAAGQLTEALWRESACACAVCDRDTVVATGGIKGEGKPLTAAAEKAMEQRNLLGLEGLLLRVDGKPVAMTMGSRLNPDTFDIHFEKALDIADGAYGAINNGFARYLREKYPDVAFLNREDDMGLEGLRKAKLSYNPHHMVEKSWACLLEDGYDY